MRCVTMLLGGLGTLGALTACWLSHQDQGLAMLLIGRTGRPALDSTPNGNIQQLLHSMCAVTFARADTGCQAEAAAILLPAATGPLLVRHRL